ncbi:tripartite motif-containing protein 55-like [Saccostrea cucullata]|uniref:tripartite motif-containing protein 55-like n=1 Tax=Saccostrea cuccullata TaxID=36930 RepID=UPI002ED34AFA
MMDPCTMQCDRTSAQDVMRCDLCKIAAAQMHCDTCLFNLCTACVEKHISDESKDHIVVKFQERKSIPVYPTCTTHSKERCEMYCKKCDIPVCISCLELNQHLGHELSKILRVLDEKKDILIKESNELNDTIYPTYQDIASDVQNRMCELENEYGDLSTAITKHGEDWHRKIGKFVKKLKAEVDEMKNTQLQTLQKHLDEINTEMSDIKEEIDSVERAIDTNDISQLFSKKTSIEHRYKNLPKKIVLSTPKFMPGKIETVELSKLFRTLSQSSLTTDKHGYSMKTTQKSLEAGSSTPVKQLLDEPETVTFIDTEYDRLFNVACLSDDEIWTSGRENAMKLYSISQGSLLKSITTMSGNWPFDIAVTKSGDLVYTDHDRTVNIVKNEKIEGVIRLQKWIPSSVSCTSSGDFLVIMDSDDGKQTKVVRYNGSKRKKQTIQFDDKGKPLYSSGFCYRKIIENRNLDICISDNGAHAVVVINQAGKLIFKYTGHTPAPTTKPFSPQGITTDSQSHILTADVNNHCVHIIDQNGQFLRYIDCGLTYPQGLCTDTNDNLFVAHQRKLRKLKYLR